MLRLGLFAQKMQIVGGVIMRDGQTACWNKSTAGILGDELADLLAEFGCRVGGSTVTAQLNAIISRFITTIPPDERRRTKHKEE